MIWLTIANYHTLHTKHESQIYTYIYIANRYITFQEQEWSLRDASISFIHDLKAGMLLPSLA